MRLWPSAMLAARAHPPGAAGTGSGGGGRNGCRFHSALTLPSVPAASRSGRTPDVSGVGTQCLGHSLTHLSLPSAVSFTCSLRPAMRAHSGWKPV
eukprot:163305-Chlamydomonas_euryale.AAC.1